MQLPPSSPRPSVPSSLRLCYILLSPTFGMHQYTADYANRMAAAGHEVHLVTTAGYPADRYAPEVQVHTPITTTDTGFNLTAVRHAPVALRAILGVLQNWPPDVIHFTGPHLWNPLLLMRLRLLGIPTLHTLHDLDPHPGSPYGPLLHLWNRAVLHTATHILVHGQCYAQRLSRYPVTHLPLLHLFLGYSHMAALTPSPHGLLASAFSLALTPSAPTVLFFGRLEKYKGVSVLLEAWARYKAAGGAGRLILAGNGALTSLWPHALPPEVEVRNRRIEDDEALALFQACSLVVLPYIGATQSALIPAAYAFGKPVIATRSGALPEYVREGETGWLIPPGDAAALAEALSLSLSDADGLKTTGKAGWLWYNKMLGEEERRLLALYHAVCSARQKQ